MSITIHQFVGHRETVMFVFLILNAFVLQGIPGQAAVHSLHAIPWLWRSVKTGSVHHLHLLLVSIPKNLNLDLCCFCNWHIYFFFVVSLLQVVDSWHLLIVMSIRIVLYAIAHLHPPLHQQIDVSVHDHFLLNQCLSVSLYYFNILPSLATI